MDSELQNYINKAKEQGLETDKIKSNLIEAGWAEDKVKKALGLEADLSVPTPNNKPSQNFAHLSHPLNSMGYLISLISFFIAIFAICFVFVTTINFYFPEMDSVSSTIISSGDLESFLQTMAFALAAVLIATPIYLIITFLSRKAEEKYPPLRKSYARKIHVFIATLVTFIVIVGYAVWVLYNLLLGDGSLNKFLTFLAIFIVNLIPFSYYLIQLRDDRKAES